jgi:ADP-heptose:LPS heptosyltransferase
VRTSLSRPDDRSVAVFFANGLGDHILTLPALRALRGALPSRLTLVTGEGKARWIFGDVRFDDVVQVAMARPGDDAARDFPVADVVDRIGGVGCLVSLVPWHSESLSALADAIRPAWSIGMHQVFDYAVDTRSVHAADRAFDVVNAFFPRLDLDDFTAPIPLPMWSEIGAQRVREAAGAGRRILVVHDETATRSKRWSPSRLEETLALLTQEYPELFVVVPSRRAPTFDVGRLGGDIASIERLSLAFFLALVADADYFIGVDSFGLHAADIYGVPALGLFGPTRAEEWGFRFTGAGTSLRAGDSMDDLTVDHVVAAFRELVAGSAAPDRRRQNAPARR